MRVIVYGAGAIGSIVGGYLHETAAETILVCSKAHAGAISQKKLWITGVQGNHRIDVPAVSDIAEISFREDDIVFLTMKTFATEESIEKIGGTAKNLAAVCLQNSVRNEEIAAPYFKRVYGGIAFFGAKYLEPGKVVHTAENSIGIGLYPEGTDETVHAISSVLEAAGFAVTSYPRIMAVKWAKLFRNLNNALFAITGLGVLEGIKYEESRFMMADILDEAARVVERAGIEILPLAGHQPPEKMIKSLRKTGDRDFDATSDEESALRPSTWQDLYLKRGRTEVEYLNGEIVRLGKKHGIPTPLNSLMVDVVNRMAREKTPPGAFSVGQLRKMLQKT